MTKDVVTLIANVSGVIINTEHPSVWHAEKSAGKIRHQYGDSVNSILLYDKDNNFRFDDGSTYTLISEEKTA